MKGVTKIGNIFVFGFEGYVEWEIGLIEGMKINVRIFKNEVLYKS